MRITRDEAKDYWRHPTQLKAGFLESVDLLADEGVEYWASGPICGLFHQAPWPNVWMVHYGVKPEGWGKLVEPSRAILRAFWEEKKPSRIVGWTSARNRAAIALTKRVGFVEDGRFDTPDGGVIMTGWSM